MKRRLVTLLSCLWLAVAAGLVQSADAADPKAENPSQKVFRAGAAASNITPPLGELVVGGWKPFPARHIHDELHARCLVLDDGESRLAIVLCDNVGIPRDVLDAARRQAHEATNIPPENILLASTHTHSATTARTANRLIPTKDLTDYQGFLARRIADGVVRAVNNLEPAKIGWGRVDVPEEVFNRRWTMTPGPHLRNPFGGVDKARMNPPVASGALLRPAGPVDPEVCFLTVQSVDGRPISLLANYSLHYVGGVGSGHVSADYFGVFAKRIEELLGAEKQDPPFVGILSNGTSGDVNNINFRERRRRYEPYEKMREVADRVAQAVLAAHKDVKFHDWVPVDGAMTELTLDVRKPTAEQLAWAKKLTADPESAPGWHTHELVYAERVMRQVDSPDQVSVPLQALRIGEVGIAAIPFEVFTQTGLTIKEKSPFPMQFTIELANGSYGYLPTPEQHELGGYETWLGSNLVEIQASRKIERQIEELLGKLAPEKD